MRLLADSSQTAKLQVIGWTSLGSLCAAQDNVLPSTTLKEVIAGFRQGFEVVTKATAVSFSWALASSSPSLSCLEILFDSRVQFGHQIFGTAMVKSKACALRP